MLGMKKATSICLILALIFCTGCADALWAEGRTPLQEYARVYSLAGEGKTFDFETLRNIQIKQTASFTFEKSDAPVSQSALFQYDYKSYEDVKSYSYEERVYGFNESEGFKPFMKRTDYGYQEDLWHQTDVEEDGSTYHKETSYPSYTSILEIPETPDYRFRAGTRLIAPELLSGFKGEPSGSVYSLTAEVIKSGINQFAEWMDALCPLFEFKENNIEGLPEGKWRWFDLSSDYDHRAEIAVQTTAQSVAKIDINFHTFSTAFYGNLGELNVQIRIEFKLGGIKVKDVRE